CTRDNYFYFDYW
nr:immunoglobulin heavy chain junction region [Mus musculus]